MRHPDANRHPSNSYSARRAVLVLDTDSDPDADADAMGFPAPLYPCGRTHPLTPETFRVGFQP
jgi:hypothetical protein